MWPLVNGNYSSGTLLVLLALSLGVARESFDQGLHLLCFKWEFGSSA